jgi:subtilase family serine protease
MLAAGIRGTGTVIAVIVPSAGPQVAADLGVYSRRSGLPAPQVQVISDGRVPPADPAWVQEGTLDLEMAHTMAPAARLIYLAIPPGTHGSWHAQFDTALAWLAVRYHPDVVSFSGGIPERWLQAGGYRAIWQARAGLEAAARAGVSVVAASGDWGPGAPEPGGALSRLYARPAVVWPASDPLVTAVGGTRLTAGAGGRYASTVFGYTDGPAGATAGGAGLSAVFSRPSWQDSAGPVVGSRRGIADVSMDASPCSPVMAYTSRGWTAMAGTSVATPLFAGLVADAAQAAGHPLGVLGPALYSMHGAADGIQDITTGTDTMPGLPSYPARAGYDLPTGIGTISAALPFVTALAAAAQVGGGRQQAQAAGRSR